mmetsp:Transcript_25409/g.54001  ORF Transcript_25409/g.54001 Transcript_25409/m.54001 type:complete len:145 (-) Transcript_25409:185-619(-)
MPQLPFNAFKERASLGDVQLLSPQAESDLRCRRRWARLTVAFERLYGGKKPRGLFENNRVRRGLASFAPSARRSASMLGMARRAERQLDLAVGQVLHVSYPDVHEIHRQPLHGVSNATGGWACLVERRRTRRTAPQLGGAQAAA